MIDDARKHIANPGSNRARKNHLLRKASVPPGEREVTPRLRTRAERAAGRSLKYDKAIGVAICDRLAEGEDLHDICQGPAMPPVATIRHWISDPNLPFAEMFKVAGELALAKMAGEVKSLADTAELNTKALIKRKMQISSRQWLLEKLAPAFKIRQEVNSNTVSTINVVTREMTDIELAREIAFVMSQRAPGAIPQQLLLEAEDVTDAEGDEE